MRVMKNQLMSIPWKGLLLILVLITLFVIYLLFKPGPPASVTLVDNLTQALFEGVGFFLTLPLFLQSSRLRKLTPAPSRIRPPSSLTTQRWVPLLLGLGILSVMIGQVLWTYNEDIAHLAVLFPSWADAGCLGSFLFVLLAILLLPPQTLPAGMRLRLLLDGLMIMVGTVTFSWYFVLGPTILQGYNSVLARVVGTAYPLATLVLISCLVLLLIQTYDREIRLTVLILSLALFILVITDSVYDFQELYNQYNTGTLLDVGWPLGYMLVGLGARALHLHLAARITSHTDRGAVAQSPPIPDPLLFASSPWQSLMPYFSLPAIVTLLVFTTYVGGNGFLEGGVYIGATLLMALLLLRQIFTIGEMRLRNKVLWTMQQDVDAKNDALRQANRQLEEHAKERERAYERERHLNELKDQFLLNVSHELRTPLTMLGVPLELLKIHYESLDSMERSLMLERALAGHEELVELVNRILDTTKVMSEIPQAKSEAVRVHQLVQEVLAALPSIQAYVISLQVPEQLLVWADAQFLRQVLRNLLSNVCKYVPTQTEIVILATQSVPSSSVCLEIADAGPGIPSEELPLLFEKFVRLKRDLAGSTPGTGLGLYICKQLVEAMGGRIWAESPGHLGKGSRFCLTLPPFSVC